jgi:hypothetical protein
MLLSKVLGVIVIARNGDRYNYYQDPKTYAASNTETTALGVVSVVFSVSWTDISWKLYDIGRVSPTGYYSALHVLRQHLAVVHPGYARRPRR